jgi:protocatechuate 3,4-dioxygenase beta subunit
MIAMIQFGRRMRHGAAAVALTLLLPGLSLAQSLGGFHGVVNSTDPVGAIIEGARVDLIDVSTQQVRSAETSPNGAYNFNEVAPGDYVIEVEKEGFEPGRAERSLASGQELEVNFALTPLPPPTGRIFGVVHDSLTQLPIAGAEVHAGIPGSANFHTTQTNENGFFVFDGLPGGFYVIETSASGYHDGRGELELPHGGVEDIRIPMQPLANASASLTGRIFDGPTTRPLAGVKVFLIGPIYPNIPPGPPTILRTTHTNEEGEFGFDGLSAGHYVIETELEGYFPVREEIELGPGEHRHITIRLQMRDAVGAVAGVVSDALTGMPIRGAIIQIEGIATLVPILTNEHGEYAFDGIPVGERKISAFKFGYEFQEKTALIEAGKRAMLDFELEPVPMPPPGAIVGQVTNAANGEPLGGVRVDYIRLPHPIGEIDERSPDFSAPDPVSFDLIDFVTTNEEGRFGIDGLRPGAYQLWFRKDGFQSEGRIVEVESGAIVEVAVELQPFVPPMGAIFGRVVDADTEAPIKGAFIWVVPDGAIVIAGLAPAIVLGQAETDADGRYVIDGLPAGELRVYAAAEGYRQAHRSIRLEPGHELRVDFALQPIDMRPNGDIFGRVKHAVTMAPIPRALVALIPDHPTSFALNAPPDLALFRLTDEEGRFRFRDIRAGRYRLVVAKTGFDRAVEEIEVVGGQVTEVRILLQPSHRPAFGRLVGRVVDAVTSEPIAGARVQVRGDRHGWLANARRFKTHTNEEGFYRFERLPADLYEIRVFKPDYEPARRFARVFPAATTRANFELEPKRNFGSLRVEVVDALTGDRIEGVRVFLPRIDEPHSSGPDSTLHAITDPNGVAEFDRVPAGRHLLVAFHRRYLPDAQAVTIRPGERTEAMFSLLPRVGPRRIWRIHCIDARTGRPLAGVRVHLPITEWIDPASDWDPWSAVTDATGVATIEDVPEGVWPLVGSADGFNPVFTPLIPDPAGGGGIGSPKQPANALAAAPADMTIAFEVEASASGALNWTIYK